METKSDTVEQIPVLKLTTAAPVPPLAIDAWFAKRGHALDTDKNNERLLVWALGEHLAKAGFKVFAVFDGEDYTKTADMKSAMELIFNLDEASLRVKQENPVPIGKSRDPGDKSREHGILLIPDNGGHGLDIISDWNFSDGDPDGFDRAMDEFLKLLNKAEDATYG